MVTEDVSSMLGMMKWIIKVVPSYYSVRITCEPMAKSSNSGGEMPILSQRRQD